MSIKKVIFLLFYFFKQVFSTLPRLQSSSVADVTLSILFVSFFDPQKLVSLHPAYSDLLFTPNSV